MGLSSARRGNALNRADFYVAKWSSHNVHVRLKPTASYMDVLTHIYVGGKIAHILCVFFFGLAFLASKTSVWDTHSGSVLA